MDLKARGGTNINQALLDALEKAKKVKENQEIGKNTQQMIVLLTDGEPTSGVTNLETILENVKIANEDLKIPIYGIAFGDTADFFLLKDISGQNYGYAQRVYESGNSFEQLEDFYEKISDTKLRNVRFEYLFDGQVVEAKDYTKSRSKRDASLKYDLATVGEFKKDASELVINMINEKYPGGEQVKTSTKYKLKNNCETWAEVTSDPTVVWEKTASEAFLDRLWAYKQIRFLLTDPQAQRALTDTYTTEDNSEG